MTDYKKMYLTVCGAVAAAMDELQGKPELAGTFQKLKDALNQAEDIYIETSGDETDTAE